MDFALLLTSNKVYNFTKQNSVFVFKNFPESFRDDRRKEIYRTYINIDPIHVYNLENSRKSI